LRCNTFTPKIDISLAGPAVKNPKFSVTKSDKPDCGFDLSYNADIQACTDLVVDNKVTFSGQAAGSKLSLVPLSSDATTGACGISLVGDINVDLGNLAGLDFCKGVTMDIVTKNKGTVSAATPAPGQPKLLNSDLELILSAKWLAGKDACSKILELTLESKGGLSLNYTTLKNTVAGYSCDGAGGAKDFISLNWAEANRIQAPGYPCCDSDYGTYVDFCNSEALIRTIGTERVENATSCPHQGVLTLCENPNLYFEKDSLAVDISPSTIQIYSNDSGASTEITATSTTVYSSTDDTYNTAVKFDGVEVRSGDADSIIVGQGKLNIIDNGGTLEAGPETIYMKSSAGGTVTINPSTIEGQDAYFVPITVCVDGENKTMYVLGTYPV
jgi:hypothetical protein